MRIEVVTLFPSSIRQALKFGVLGRAVERGIVLSVRLRGPARAHARTCIARWTIGRMAAGREWC